MLQLEVGKYYRARNGNKVYITSKNNNSRFPFNADNRRYYTNNGDEWTSSESDYDLIEEWKDEGQHLNEVAKAFASETTKIKSDGGSTSYYNLPENAKELNDIIEAKNMSFARGEAFKGLYRLGEKDGTETLYDVNKIIYFAERMKARILRGEKP